MNQPLPFGAVVRRLASASLDTAVTDPGDRNTLPMSTLIASDQWLLEASWDGAVLGDVHVFKNANCAPNGLPILSGEKDENGKLKPVPPRWVWWGGVPRGRIKSYRFLDVAELTPASVQEAVPTTPDVKREAKPAADGEGGARRRS